MISSTYSASPSNSIDFNDFSSKLKIPKKFWEKCQQQSDGVVCLPGRKKKASTEWAGPLEASFVCPLSQLWHTRRVCVCVDDCRLLGLPADQVTELITGWWFFFFLAAVVAHPMNEIHLKIREIKFFIKKFQNDAAHVQVDPSNEWKNSRPKSLN